MADRFYSEGTDRSSVKPDGPEPKVNNAVNSQKKNTLGDFSVNIDSNVPKGTGVPVQKPQKFQLNINNFDEFVSENPVEQPSVKRTSAIKRKTTANVENVARRPVKKSTRPVEQAVNNGQSASTNGTQQKRKLTEAQKARIKARKRYNFIKSILISCVCIIFITIITVGASTVALNTINDILVLDKENVRSVRVDIPEGAKYEDVYNILCESGLVKQTFFTDFFLRFRHYDTVSYEPAAYYLQSDMGIETMIESIMVKRTVSKDTVRLTFPEGWTIAEIFEKIEKYGVCTAEKLYANLDIVAGEYDFIDKIGDVSGRYLKAEGYLFPDTYDFFIDESASSVLRKLFNNFESKWTSAYTNRAKELGMTKDQIINIASMIQAEAKDASQMKDISSVLHNRLSDPATYPTLDMNSTKDYITTTNEYGVFADFYYELYIGTYNTYSAKGLAPGPVCNPGMKAIEAALYPNDTSYYFFCHSATGEIYLAKTVSEHQANVQKALY